MKHISEEEVLYLHDIVIQCYGGCPGCPDEFKLSALLSRVLSYEYCEGLTDVFALAAMYFVSIAKGHVFVDGNKRTAITVCFMFLKRNGITTHQTLDMDDVAVKVASDRMSALELAAYLRANFGETST